MIDLGTGPGDIPILLAERLVATEPDRTFHITAVDLSAAMLGIARERIAASEHGDRITVMAADVKRLPFAVGSFDTVFSNTILHHLADPVPMLTEARRVLRPGGVLLIRDLYRPGDEATLERLVETHAAGESARQKRQFADSLRAAFTADELGDLLRQLHWTEPTVTIDTDRHLSIQITADSPQRFGETEKKGL
jgi:ubiquinone/menaquinone biosynthesis C-methylase UbiE